MQVRKLIRLLSELVEKDPKMAYREVCLDRRFVEAQCKEWTFIQIPDVETRWCIWNSEESMNEIQREVVVLGNY